MTRAHLTPAEAFAVIAAHALALIGAAPRPAKPSIEMHVTPVVAFIPAEIQAWAKVVDPEGAMTCPAVVWTWGDGCVSRRDPDCDPYAFHEPREWILHAPVHVYHLAGDWVVRVEVSDAQVGLTSTRAVRLLWRAGS